LLLKPLILSHLSRILLRLRGLIQQTIHLSFGQLWRGRSSGVLEYLRLAPLSWNRDRITWAGSGGRSFTRGRLACSARFEVSGKLILDVRSGNSLYTHFPRCAFFIRTPYHSRYHVRDCRPLSSRALHHLHLTVGYDGDFSGSGSGRENSLSHQLANRARGVDYEVTIVEND
jgi:hypothetical protein